MKETTLCYLERDGAYLMLLRNKKEKDVNAGKWIGVGGHLEEGETPEECVRREIAEETGLCPGEMRYRGIVDFLFLTDRSQDERMYLYTSTDFEGEPSECDEGTLRWIPKGDLMDLNLWEGDRIFLRILLEDGGFFKLRLAYEGDRLVSAQKMND